MQSKQQRPTFLENCVSLFFTLTNQFLYLYLIPKILKVLHIFVEGTILINPSAAELVFIGKPKHLNYRFSERRQKKSFI